MIPHSKPTVGPREAAAAARVTRSGRLAQGPEVAAFEAEMASSLGVCAAAAVATGTKALELALRALGAGPGHEVLIPSFVCSALWHAVRRVGAQPVLVDCEEGGVNADMKDAARKRTRRTKAIILTHLFGLPADVSGARALGVPILEDCAQALGGRWNGRPLGSLGEAAVLSFYATKLMTTGEGGMVVSRDRRLVARVQDLRQYDEKPPLEVLENAKMTELQAAIGRVQLRRLDFFLRKRRRLAAVYDRALAGLDLGLPPDAPGRVYYRYVARVPHGKIDALARTMACDGVAARRSVYRPLHLDVPCRGAFPNAQRAWEACLSIPLYPTLSPRQQSRVIGALQRARENLANSAYFVMKP